MNRVSKQECLSVPKLTHSRRTQKRLRIDEEASPNLACESPIEIGSDGGWGAWEVALRYSFIDLDDSAISGGTLSDITFGLNWHPNPATRVMLNYVSANLKDVGQAGIFMIRFGVDF